MPETNIYDYEFTVNESEPKRADMLNRLKNRVKHVDKREVIASDEFVDGESSFDEDKALSAFLLYKLFPTKVNLLKEHYTKGEVDGLLNDLVAKYYLKDQIDSMLNNLKNDLKSSLDMTGNGLQQLVNSLKSDLSKHRTLDEIDHPDASVTTRKIRDHAITKDKLSADLLLNIDAKANKAGDTFAGLVTFNQGLRIPSLDLLNTNTFHSIKSNLNARGESDLDIGTYDTTHQVNLCSTNNPGWYDANRNWHRFLVQNDLDDINNKINELRSKMNSGIGKILYGDGNVQSERMNKVFRYRSQGYKHEENNVLWFRKYCDLPENYSQIMISYLIAAKSRREESLYWHAFVQPTYIFLTKQLTNSYGSWAKNSLELNDRIDFWWIEDNKLYGPDSIPYGNVYDLKISVL